MENRIFAIIKAGKRDQVASALVAELGDSYYGIFRAGLVSKGAGNDTVTHYACDIADTAGNIATARTIIILADPSAKINDSTIERNGSGRGANNTERSTGMDHMDVHGYRGRNEL